MNTSYSFADAQRMLIKPFERLKFVIIFILVTGLAQVLAHSFSCHLAFNIPWKGTQVQYRVMRGLIGGVFVGTAQWFILRKYISDWKWILVAGLSSMFLSSTIAASAVWRESIITSASAHRLSEKELFLNTALSLAFNGVFFIPTYLQWYLLRPYITKARWWIFLPFTTVLTWSFPLSLIFFTHGFLRFNLDILGLAMWPATQAMAFCFLKKKSGREYPIYQTPLALTPDIVNYWDVQRLKEILEARISRIWKTDLKPWVGQLIYLVGVSRSPAIITYEPANQASVDNVDQTPLPEVASAPRDITLGADEVISFAKFQVVFTPPSMVQVYPWRSLPLLWLGVILYVGIIGISFLCAWFKIDILNLAINIFLKDSMCR